VGVPQDPARVPSQWSLAPSVMLSVNDKGDNEVKPRAVNRSPGIYLKAEETPGKHQLGDILIKAVRLVVA
jgi:hypothetical protein